MIWWTQHVIASVVRVQNWTFVITCSSRPHNCKQVISRRGRTRRRASGKFPKTKNELYCFSLPKLVMFSFPSLSWLLKLSNDEQTRRTHEGKKTDLFQWGSEELVPEFRQSLGHEFNFPYRSFLLWFIIGICCRTLFKYAKSISATDKPFPSLHWAITRPQGSTI